MESIREWWAAAFETVRHAMTRFVDRVVDGVFYDWNVRYFIFALGAILVIGLIGVWRRKA